MATVYLGLGSNMGDRRRNLSGALERLSRFVEIDKMSPVYDTAPVGNPHQGRFLNLVCRGRIALPALELLKAAKAIEREMGRQPGGERNSPRPIDIDILFYGDEVINTGELIIPHPRLAERAFVLVPLAEIAPGLLHTVSGKTIGELAAGVGGKEGVVRLEEELDVPDNRRG